MYTGYPVIRFSPSVQHQLNLHQNLGGRNKNAMLRDKDEKQWLGKEEFWPAGTSNTMQVRLTIWPASGIHGDIIVYHQGQLKDNGDSGMNKRAHKGSGTYLFYINPTGT